MKKSIVLEEVDTFKVVLQAKTAVDRAYGYLEAIGAVKETILKEAVEGILILNKALGLLDTATEKLAEALDNISLAAGNAEDVADDGGDMGDEYEFVFTPELEIN